MRETSKPKTPAIILNEEQTKAFLAKKFHTAQEALDRIENRKKLGRILKEDMSKESDIEYLVNELTEKR